MSAIADVPVGSPRRNIAIGFGAWLPDGENV